MGVIVSNCVSGVRYLQDLYTVENWSFCATLSWKPHPIIVQSAVSTQYQHAADKSPIMVVSFIIFMLL